MKYIKRHARQVSVGSIHREISPEQRQQSPLHPLLVLKIAIQLSFKQFFFIIYASHDNKDVRHHHQKRPPGTQHQWHHQKHQYRSRVHRVPHYAVESTAHYLLSIHYLDTTGQPGILAHHLCIHSITN